jgi:hypothetical protein
VRIYTLCTSSHSVFRDEWFLPTVSALQDKFELMVTADSSLPDGAIYGTKDFNRLMKTKVDLLVDAIRDCWGQVFIYSDSDVQFFRPILEDVVQLIGDKDLLVQRDSPQGHLCAGFMILRADWPLLNLFQEIKQKLALNSLIDDQAALNIELMKDGVGGDAQGMPYDQLVTVAYHRAGEAYKELPHIANRFGVRWNYLPSSFFGGGTESGKAWKPGDEIALPDDAAMHHANWTEGNENKIAQLRYVRQRYEARFAHAVN